MCLEEVAPRSDKPSICMRARPQRNVYWADETWAHLFDSSAWDPFEDCPARTCKGVNDNALH